MQLHAFINRLPKSGFVFEGIYTVSPGPVGAQTDRPLRLQFEFWRGDKSILVEGGCYRANAQPPFAFAIEIPFSEIHASSASVEIRSPEIEALVGKVQPLGEGLEILVSSPAGSLGSIHINFFSQTSFSVSGMLMQQGRCIAFTAREGGEWEKVAAAKIYSLSRRA